MNLDRAGKLELSTAVIATPRPAKKLVAENDRLRRELACAKVDKEILKAETMHLLVNEFDVAKSAAMQSQAFATPLTTRATGEVAPACRTRV